MRDDPPIYPYLSITLHHFRGGMFIILYNINFHPLNTIIFINFDFFLLFQL
jgi:hypothetical protein